MARILVPLKWSALRTEVEPLTGVAHVLPGRFGPDPASAAALEWALRLVGAADGVVTVVTIGPEAAEAGLREAVALGAAEAVRVEGPADPDPLEVAAVLASLASSADVVVLGSRSIDRGSAAVAPALATLLERPAACGLLGLKWADDHILAERRLPAGQRERVRVAIPAVVSVEWASVELRRASLPATLAASQLPIERVTPERPPAAGAASTVLPYRPRPRKAPPPPAGEQPRERIAALSGALEAGSHAQQLELPPEEAAVEIIGTLRRWGYLD
jgi:electron transfer flavoprotein beta subunit